MIKRIAVYVVVIVVTTVAFLVVGMNADRFLGGSSGGGGGGDGGYGGYAISDLGQIQFNDALDSNASPTINLHDLSFVDVAGNKIHLNDYLGKKNVVLVITRGYAGSICVYCSTQTSRLIAQYPEVAKRDAEVVVVYPVKDKQDERRLDEFLANVKKNMDAPPERIPFPLTLDTGLTAVDQLGIRRDLSKPATYILDKQGKVRFAYVGASLADRPSVKAILGQLDSILAADKN